MYLHASEDENPIHQGKAAVVPGFLMVNRILEGYGDCIGGIGSGFTCLSDARNRQSWSKRKQENKAGLWSFSQTGDASCR